MKTIKVVAAVIQDKSKCFSTQRGYGEYKGGWEFPVVKLNQERVMKLLLFVR